MSQSDVVAHFGLGDQKTHVRSVLIEWPDGTRQRLRDVPVNQTRTIRQPALAATPQYGP